MAEVAGKNGSITYSGITAGVSAWTLDYTADTIEVTDYADSGKKTYIVGCTGWTATATANWDTANTAVPGDSASLTLTVTSGETYSGTAIITSMRVASDVLGKTTCEYTFQGTGALTITSA